MINNKRSHEVVSLEGMIHILQKRCQSAVMGQALSAAALVGGLP